MTADIYENNVNKRSDFINNPYTVRNSNTLKNIRVYTYTRNIKCVRVHKVKIPCVRVHTKISNTLQHEHLMYFKFPKFGIWLNLRT